jgi:glycosyltransferase involved in cell wall biosynthesis
MPFPIFLSVVYVIRNRSAYLEGVIQEATEQLSSMVTDYELIIVDNASDDQSVKTLKTLSGLNGYPNLQVYALTKEVSDDAAAWVGLENSLGDFVAVVNPLQDKISFLETMLEKASTGADVVFTLNKVVQERTFPYAVAYWIFNSIYQFFNRVHLAKDAPNFRLLSRRMINFILQHRQPEIMYRHIPATAGFSRVNLEYTARPLVNSPKRFFESVDRGVRLLVSSTQGPMRLVTSLSLFGAFANLFYSIYVLSVGIFKTDVTPGWVSLSLQQSGMFLLITLVLWVLGEYILNMASLSNEGPAYHISQEFSSVRMTSKEKLNVQESLTLIDDGLIKSDNK